MNPLKAWSRFDWFSLILFAALVTLFHWRILTPNMADRQSFPPGDFSAQFWAFTTFEARELSVGRLPLWNPYTFAGAPFWADVQAAVFYPPSLLTLLLSAPAGFSLFALEIEAIAHFWLAAALMYLFVRQVTQSRSAALMAALIFTFSGYLTGYPGQQLAVLEADVWLPLILFFLYRGSRPGPAKVARASAGQPETLDFDSASRPRRSPRPWLLLAGAAWGVTLLAGHPQSALIVAYLSSAYFFFLRLPMPPGVRVTRSVLRFAVILSHWLIFILTGLALAAVQFIPAVEYTRLSVRAEGVYDKMAGGFPLADLVQLLLPGQVSVYSPLYVGVVGLILACWGAFVQPNRSKTFWAAAALVSLFISFGGNTFLYSPLYLFTPGFSIFRGQERWAFAVVFSFSVLAGYGWKTLQEQIANYKLQITAYPAQVLPSTIRNTQYILRFTQYLLFFSLLLVFLFFYGLNNTGWTPASPFYHLLGGATLLTLLLALAWLLWKFSPRLPPLVFTGLAAALICFDLFTANWQTNLYPQGPQCHTQMPNAVAAIKQDTAASPNQPYRVYNEFRLYDNYGVSFEIEDLWGASPLRPRRYDEFLAPPMPIERAWELLNVKYVITWRQELFVPSTIIYQEPADGGVTYVHRLNKVGPRAWLVTQAEIHDDAAILQKIADPRFDRWRTALLEPEAAQYVGPITGSNNKAWPQNPSSVSGLTFHTPQSLSATVTSPVPALLIFSEIHYPGWQAEIDGQPAPLLRANYALRAVPVPAGEHTVRLTFRPPTFLVGAIVSAMAFFVIIILLVIYRRKELA
ncbi:MAG: YfhO family protein [Anaerolineae bacterium]|nr:YfhO family protein [Anaerolineae bacterium]